MDVTQRILKRLSFALRSNEVTPMRGRYRRSLADAMRAACSPSSVAYRARTSVAVDWRRKARHVCARAVLVRSCVRAAR
jgi:hypothetical protein